MRHAQHKLKTALSSRDKRQCPHCPQIPPPPPCLHLASTLPILTHLPPLGVLQVARSKHSRHTGGRPVKHLDVPLVVQLNLVGDQLGVGGVADAVKHACHLQVGLLTCRDVHQPR